MATELKVLICRSYKSIIKEIQGTFKVRLYTAPRIDLIPEQQERYQVIENLMLLENSMRKGKEILRQFRHQRSSWLTLPYKNLFYLSLDHLLSSTSRIPNRRPNQVCCTLFIQIPPLWLYQCILKKVLWLGREPPRRTLSSETTLTSREVLNEDLVLMNVVLNNVL